MPKKTTAHLHIVPALHEPARAELQQEDQLAGLEPAKDESRGQAGEQSAVHGANHVVGDGLAINRAELAQAIHHWGQAGQEAEPGMKLTQEASALVEVLAVMDFERQDSVLLPRSSRPGQLVMQAREARDAQMSREGASGPDTDESDERDERSQKNRHRG